MIGNPFSRRAFGSYLLMTAGSAFFSLWTNPNQTEHCLGIRKSKSSRNPDLNKALKCNVESPLMRAVFGSIAAVFGVALVVSAESDSEQHQPSSRLNF